MPRLSRRHSAAILALALQDRARHFTWHPERMDVVSAYVAQVIRQRYPDLKVPYHARWRHFEAGGVDRWQALARTSGLAQASRLERARARVDLVVVSVLLDAGAGPQWTYQDTATGQCLSRSEGLGVASLQWWAQGGMSSDAGKPWQADAEGLSRIEPAALAQAFQVNDGNPLVGVPGRVALLKQLGAALTAHPDVYGIPGEPGLLRPGHLVDALIRQSPSGQVPAAAVLSLLLKTLGTIWPGRHVLDGMPLGDCWPHPDAPGDGCPSTSSASG
ncbi:MAG: DUF1688 family protein [Aquabacterium sp.]